ncbi:hypothetical protein ABIG06_006084 [Bradyrhizobium sp. USDA 326]
MLRDDRTAEAILAVTRSTSWPMRENVPTGASYAATHSSRAFCAWSRKAFAAVL